ncbi:hypothetical protein C8N35_10713 [Breoghania corrubedonensis]|uniref:Uncharacterized protein n=1 Tax=Breoghania corrubedonensis TaxID=665038 RepID=A0A2T5V6C2_9HYPH|nr:hypothetical protein [Breoghania corrubedonensis]PTW59300.1 hypothetical protein C8N35_10713 [Breoghania corrubedonensis]
MTVRTTDTEITFERSFMLSAFDARQPAGTYRLVVDEEEISGLSFLAYRRTATMLHIPAISVQSDRYQVVEVDPEELAAALDADALASRPHKE